MKTFRFRFKQRGILTDDYCESSSLLIALDYFYGSYGYECELLNIEIEYH